MTTILDHPADQICAGTQGSPVGGATHQPTSHRRGDTQAPPAGGFILPADQRTDDNQSRTVGGDHTSSSSQPDGDTHAAVAAAGSDRNGPPASHTTIPLDGPLADPFLALAADVLDDAEQNRIANENRLRQLTRNETDTDGEERGFGLDETHPDVARLAAIVDMLAQVEHQAELNLKRMLRNHPLGPWVQTQKGIGEKQAARLLAVIGDPCAKADGTPRRVSDLWSYCGHGDATRKRRKGMTQADLFMLGNPIAKSRLWLIACACLKAQGPYAEVYYARRDATTDRIHVQPCVRCGPAGHPAPAGTHWSKAHQHADALRIVGKTILRDLWLEARRIHEERTP